MLRWQKFLSFFMLLLTGYLFFIYFGNFKDLNRNGQLLFLWSPFILLVLYGCYALFVILKNVINLRNYPSESVSLNSDIAEAKQYLKRQGFKFDSDVNDQTRLMVDN
ncbi:hypothetical protein WA158_005646 [Blastocystis sp. Blastoise]